MKTCITCGLEKENVEFLSPYRTKTGKIMFRRRCSGCIGPTAQKDRRYAMYGLKLGQYDQMAEKQKNLCAICQNEEIVQYMGKIKPLSVDHSHESGKVRGLLCNTCNIGLGYFKDSEELLRRAAEYIDFYH